MPSSVLDGQIKLYQLTDGIWKREGSQGTKSLTKSVDDLPSNDPSVMRASDGDWLITRKYAKSVFISKAKITDVCAVYYFDKGKWHQLRWVSKTRGHSEHRVSVRERLKDFEKVADNTIALDEGLEKGLIVFGPQSDRGVHYVLEELLEFSDYENILSRTEDYDQYLLNKADTAEEARVEAIMKGAQQYLDSLQSSEAKRLFQHFAGWEQDADKSENLLRALGNLLGEGMQTPAASGITGTNDITQLINNLKNKFHEEFESANYLDIKKHEMLEGGAARFAKADAVFSALAAFGALYSAVTELRSAAKLQNNARGTNTGDKQHSANFNTKVTTGGASSLKILTSTVSALKTTSEVCNNPAFGVFMQGMAKVTGPLGIAIGAFTAFRFGRKSLRARTRQAALKSIFSEDGLVDCPELKCCVEFLLHKVRRKKFYQGATGSVAGISCGAGICLTLAGVGAGNAWNPVGWVLLSTAAAGGLGLTGYKVFRRWKIEDTHNDRRAIAAGANIADAESAARALVRIYRFDKDKNCNRCVLSGKILDTFGVDVSELEKSEAVREAAIAMVVRHAVF